MNVSCHLRAKGAAAYLGISQSTLWRWVKQGRINKGTRLSARCTVWPREELEKFMQEQASTSAGEQA
ncbi:MAG TPA: helix-turn-helix domain-containing protein [Candidatus Mailhella merdavium]|nr:helix-turn-helix domain-containing protein [Candidatus Mailhella merdavium]